jgi:hypothetical protein
MTAHAPIIVVALLTLATTATTATTATAEPPAPAATPLPGPALAEVIAAAHAAAGLDRDDLTSWTRRSRLAGLVPWLSVRTGRDTRWRDDASDVIRLDTVEVRATWRLDRLVFDKDELHAQVVDHARRRDRRRLAARVVRAYYAWRRAAATIAITPGGALRADEAIGELDALTEGWFSAALARTAGP